MVKRYTAYLYYRDVCMGLDPEGDYVFYKDYVEIERRCAELQSLLNESITNTAKALNLIARWSELNEQNVCSSM